MNERRGRLVRAVLLIALGAVLLWQVIMRSLVSYLAVEAPATALELQPTEPVALLTLADKELHPADAKDPNASSGTSGAPPRSSRERQTDERIAAAAKLALLNDPLNARALRILGQLADRRGDHAAALDLMRAAVQRSRRESTAVYWLMQESYERKDYAGAASYADTLLRTRSGLMTDVLPALVKMAGDVEASIELKGLLAGNPPWRARFFSELPNSVSDVRTPLDLLLAMRDTPTPPTPGDIDGYLEFLIKHRFYDLAYYAWLQFLPPEHLTGAGLLFNDSFELPLSGLPFDWTIAPGSGVTIGVATRPDAEGQRALFVEFGHGRVQFGDVAQLVTLAPGTYRLKGKYKGEVRGRRGLQWLVRCAGSQSAPAGESPMMTGATPAWKEFDFTFTVPSAGCPGQYVRLEFAARSASEQLVSGAVWYDELRLSRVPDTQFPAAAPK